MAESKQYVAQSLDNGSVQISEAVIAEVVAHAVGEVKGVVGINTKSGSDFADFLNKKKWNKGLKITVTDSNKVIIECDIVVYYGQNVVKIADAANYQCRQVPCGNPDRIGKCERVRYCPQVR